MGEDVQDSHEWGGPEPPASPGLVREHILQEEVHMANRNPWGYRKESRNVTSNVCFNKTHKTPFSQMINRVCVWYSTKCINKVWNIMYLIDPQWWSCPATERIPSVPRVGRVLGSWADQRSSCARLGYVDSRHKPAWWWKPGPGTPDWQKCQISEHWFKSQNIQYSKIIYHLYYKIWLISERNHP